MGHIAEILDHASPVLPVLVVENPQLALPLAEALLRGGLAVLELTLRTPQALESLWLIQQELPEMVVGAGTVLDAEQARQAQQAVRLCCQSGLHRIIGAGDQGAGPALAAGRADCFGDPASARGRFAPAKAFSGWSRRADAARQFCRPLSGHDVLSYGWHSCR